MGNKLTPFIRFKGFKEDWEQRKLGDLLNYEQPTKYIVKSTDYDDNFEIPVLTAGQSFILGYTNEREGIKGASKEKPVIIFDDFTTGSHYVDFPFKVKSSAMKLLDLVSENYDFYFVYNILKKINYIPQSHERHWISKFSNFQIYLPNQNEQKKIGAFFKSLDDTIALQERKLELLKIQKKGYLQKMFPKQNEKVPELRFKGFNDTWEQRKFKDLVDSKDGIRRGPFGSALKKDLFVKESEYVVYEQQNAIYDRFDTRYNITEEKYNELIKFKVEPGDFIMSGAGTIGRISMVPNSIKSGVFNQALIRFRLNHERTDSKYFLQLMRSETMQRKLTESNPGSAMVNLVPMSEVKEWDILVPNISEQRLLGEFFTILDDTIDLHQRKLEFLKQMKKSLLQKMFV